MMMMQDAAIKEEGAPAAIPAAPRNEGRPRMRRAFQMPRGMENGRWKTVDGKRAAGARRPGRTDGPASIHLESVKRSAIWYSSRRMSASKPSAAMIASYSARRSASSLTPLATTLAIRHSSCAGWTT